MPLIKNITPDRSSILCVWKIEETIDNLISIGQFNNYELDILNETSNLKVQAQKMAARILIKETLGDSFILKHEVNGKPYIQDIDINISISHSKEIVAVFFSRDKIPGVDVEYHNQRIYRITHKYLSDKEKEQLEGKGIEDLLLYWNAKEVIYKILNDQMLNFKEHITIYPFEIVDGGFFNGMVNFHNTKIDFNLHYELFDNYTLVWSLK